MNADIDITGIKLETERLILRPFEEGDLFDLYEYASVEGVGEMAGWKHHESLEESKEILEKLFIEGKITFALVYKENNKVIGSLGIEKYREEELEELKELKCREIGYVLSKDYWGQGLMVEAVKEALRYCFEELKLDAVTCGHSYINNQSRRVIEKSGFKFLKDIDFETRMKDRIILRVYVLYREDYIND